MGLASWLGLAKPAGEGVEAAGRGIATAAGGIRSAITGELPPETRERLAEIEGELRQAQVALNQTEAQHASVFVAGWRPAIGWCCAIALAYHFLIQPIAAGLGLPLPAVSLDDLWPVIIGMLGMGAMRSYEKARGVQGRH